MEEQFILRVPPRIAEQIRKILRSKEAIPLSLGKEKEDSSKRKDESNNSSGQDANMHISFEGNCSYRQNLANYLRVRQH